MKIRQWREVKNYNKEELIAKLEETKKKLFEDKMKNNINPIKNPLEIRNLRRDIARIKSLLLNKFNVRY